MLTAVVPYVRPEAMTAPRGGSADLPFIGSLLVSDEDEHEPKAGDVARSREAFRAAVAPLVPRLFRLCLILTREHSAAEDLLQATLVRAFIRWRSYAGSGSLHAWLYQVTRNLHRDRCRAETRRRNLFSAVKDTFEDISSRHTSTTDPERWVAESDDTAFLMECLSRVPEPYRTAVLLCDIEELTQAEAAQALDVPLGTIKSRQLRGRRILRKLYEQRGER